MLEIERHTKGVRARGLGRIYQFAHLWSKAKLSIHQLKSFNLFHLRYLPNSAKLVLARPCSVCLSSRRRPNSSAARLTGRPTGQLACQYIGHHHLESLCGVLETFGKLASR